MKEVAPQGERGKVQKGECDRLFEFVDQIAGKKNIGDVRLLMNDVRRAVRVEGRLQHRSDQLRTIARGWNLPRLRALHSGTSYILT